MKKLRFIALIIVVVFFFNLWSGVVFYISTGGPKAGALAKPIIDFAKFPLLIVKGLEEIRTYTISKTYVNQDPNFKEMNAMSYDLFGLQSYWDHDLEKWKFELINFKDDSVFHTWEFKEESILKAKYDRQFKDLRPLHTILVENKAIIVNFANSNNLFKIDSNSNILWKNNELGFHHSMNFDPDGDIWVCASPTGEYVFLKNTNKYSSKVKNLNRAEITYNDDLLVKIDRNSGKIIYSKSVSEILDENNYRGLLINSMDYQCDPIHLNDIQPALDDTEFWKKGDLFLSLRSVGSIFQYRPSTGKVIWSKHGPFLGQHDVDIISPKKISVFNNNMNWAWNSQFTEKQNNLEPRYSLKNNEIIIYDFERDTLYSILSKYFMEEKICTWSEGLSEFLSNGDVFVEEQNHGRVYILNENGFILKKVFKTSVANKAHTTNWIRLYEKNPLIRKP